MVNLITFWNGAVLRTAQHIQTSSASAKSRPAARLVGKGSETAGGNEVVGYDNLGIPLSFHRPSSCYAQFGASASASSCLSSFSVSHPLPLPPSPPRQYRSTGTQCPSACDVDCSPVHLRQSRLCRALFPSPPFPWSGLAELSCASVRFLCVDAEPALYGDPVRTRRACTHARLRQLALDGTDPTHSVDRTSLTLSGAAAASFLHCSGSRSLAGQPTRGKLG